MMGKVSCLLTVALRGSVGGRSPDRVHFLPCEGHQKVL